MRRLERGPLSRGNRLLGRGRDADPDGVFQFRPVTAFLATQPLVIRLASGTDCRALVESLATLEQYGPSDEVVVHIETTAGGLAVRPTNMVELYVGSEVVFVTRPR